jgi:hypothetical protein
MHDAKKLLGCCVDFCALNLKPSQQQVFPDCFE